MFLKSIIRRGMKVIGQYKQLVIRADASAQIGSGHVMRCLALAQAWRDNYGEVIFITSKYGGNLLERLRSEGFKVVILGQVYPAHEDLKITRFYLNKAPNSWLVLDGYHFDSNYQKIAKQSGCKLLVIDGKALLSYYYSDIVVNPNPFASRLYSCYRCKSENSLLLGVEYVFLRKEFLKWKNYKKEIPARAKNILITFGGGKIDNVAYKVLSALNNLSFAEELNVVLVARRFYIEDIIDYVSTVRYNINVRESNDIPSLMSWADIAISASGVTVWELAFMKVPTMLIITADNQEAVATELGKTEAFVLLGWWNQVKESTITQEVEELLKNYWLRFDMSYRAGKLVDGEGVNRVISIMY